MYINAVSHQNRPSSRSSQIPSSSSFARILGSRQRQENQLDREQIVTERGSELLRRQRELRAQAAVLQPPSASFVPPIMISSTISPPSTGTPRRPLSASRSGRTPRPSQDVVPPSSVVSVDPFDLDARVEITEEIARRPPSRKNSAAYDLFSSSSISAERASSKPAIPASSTFKDRPQSRGLEPPAALHLDSPPVTPPSAVWAAPSSGNPKQTISVSAEVLTLEDIGSGSSSLDSPMHPDLSDEPRLPLAARDRPLSRPSSSYLGGQRTQRPPLVLDGHDLPVAGERRKKKHQRPTTSSGVFRPPTSAGFHSTGNAGAGGSGGGGGRAAGRGHSAFRTSLDREFLGLFAN